MVFENRHVVIYALPQGGVVLGVEIAKKLNTPLNPEYALCATSENAHSAIGSYYESFPQVTDEEVINLMKGVNEK